MDSSEVGRRTVSSVGWNALSTVVTQAGQFVFGAILAHLLLPRDFGLVAMILVFTGFAGLFVDLGFGPALVQRSEIEQRHLNSAFWLNVVAGTLATAVTMALAPGIAAFYGQPRLLGLVLAGAPSFLMTSLGGVQNALLERALNFRRIALIENAAFLVGNTLALVMAFTGFGVWSLIAQTLAVNGLATAGLWLVGDWRPTAWPDRQSVAELWKFSGHFTGFNVLNYFALNADNLLVGKFIGTLPLAYYSRAYNLMRVPQNLISPIAGRVIFSSFSRIQDNLDQVKDAYLRFLGATGLLAIPASVEMFVVARPFIVSAYGARWAPVVPLLEILAAVSAFRCFFQGAGLIFTSQGRTDLMFRWSVGGSIGVVAAFGIGLPWGTTGVATAYLVWNILIAVPALRSAGRLIGSPLGDLAAALGGVTACSAVMGAVTWLAEASVPGGWNEGWKLALGLAIGALSYFVALEIGAPKPYRDARLAIEQLRRREPTVSSTA